VILTFITTLLVVTTMYLIRKSYVIALACKLLDTLQVVSNRQNPDNTQIKMSEFISLVAKLGINPRCPQRLSAEAKGRVL
jgi:hypothetical protein